MASQVLDDCQIFWNDVDLTGHANQVRLGASADTLDVSTFSSGWRQHIQGAKTLEFALGGPWGFTEPDAETWDAINSAASTPALTFAVESTAGSVAYMCEPVGAARDTGGTYGDMGTWELTGRAQRGSGGATLYRGGLSLAKQTITGATNGTGVQLANLASNASDRYAAVVHVFVDNGTSVDVILERDDNSSFTSATTIATVAVSAVGQTWTYSTGGSLGSDDWFRARTANLTGTSFDLAVAIGTSIAT